VRSLIAVLVIMPVVAVMLARAFSFAPLAEIALMALAISPVPPILPGKQTKSGGDTAYGVALMAILAALAVVTIPLSSDLIQRLFHRSVDTASATARIAFMSTLLPLGIGMLVRAWLPALAGRLAPVVGRVAKVLLPLAAVALLAGTWRAVWNATGEGTLLAMIVFAVIGLFVGHVLGGPEPSHSVVLALATASRHPAIALSIASASFPDQRFVGTILLYLIVNALVGLPYLSWQKNRRITPDAPPFSQMRHRHP
jgi:BASS family bile acid:Na+ symporter